MPNETITMTAPAPTESTEIHPPKVGRLSDDELYEIVDKIVDAFPSTRESKHTTRRVIEDLVRHRLLIEPFLVYLEVVTGTDRAMFATCTSPEQCLLGSAGRLAGCKQM